MDKHPKYQAIFQKIQGLQPQDQVAFLAQLKGSKPELAAAADQVAADLGVKVGSAKAPAPAAPKARDPAEVMKKLEALWEGSGHDKTVLAKLRHSKPDVAAFVDQFATAKGMALPEVPPDEGAAGAGKMSKGMAKKIINAVGGKAKAKLKSKGMSGDPASAFTPMEVTQALQVAANSGDGYARSMKTVWQQLQQRAIHAATTGGRPWEPLFDSETQSMHIITAAGPSFSFKMNTLDGIKRYQAMLDSTKTDPIELSALAHKNAEPMNQWHRVQNLEPGQARTKYAMLAEPEAVQHELDGFVERTAKILGQAGRAYQSGQQPATQGEPDAAQAVQQPQHGFGRYHQLR